MIKFAAAVAAALLLASPAALAQSSSKTTVAKDKRPGTTGAVGNRCHGGSYDACVKGNMKVGYTASQASRHCTRTCK